MRGFLAASAVLFAIACGDAAPFQVTVSPASVSLLVGTSTDLLVVVTDGSGQQVTPTTIDWRSSATDVASVDSAGTVSALKGGSATISAATPQGTGSAAITVVPVVSGKWSGTSDGTVVFLNLSETDSGGVQGTGTLSGTRSGSLSVASGSHKQPTVAITCLVSPTPPGGSGFVVLNGTLSADGLQLTGVLSGFGFASSPITMTRR